MRLRYEDVTQDGRLRLTAMPPAFGETVWARLGDHPINTTWRDAGIVPILTRVTAGGGGGPVDVREPVDAEGSFRIAHTDGPRMLLTMRVELRGRKGHIHFPPRDAGALVELGWAETEATFTRPFGPPETRRVTELPGVDRGPYLPLAKVEDLLELPDGAEPLDDWAPGAPVVFGLDHTDSNQHVNSLAYPSLFVDEALRRFATLGRKTAVLATGLDVRFRKPCFAGERVDVHLRAFRLGRKLGIAGWLGADSPRCSIRLLFE